jgi:hypothetical protein
MAMVALGLRMRTDLTQEEASSFAINYILADIARQNRLDERTFAGKAVTYQGKVLQRLRDIENKRPDAAKVVAERFHNPRTRETMVPGILEAIDGALATVPADRRTI